MFHLSSNKRRVFPAPDTYSNYTINSVSNSIQTGNFGSQSTGIRTLSGGSSSYFAHSPTKSQEVLSINQTWSENGDWENFTFEGENGEQLFLEFFCSPYCDQYIFDNSSGYASIFLGLRQDSNLDKKLLSVCWPAEDEFSRNYWSKRTARPSDDVISSSYKEMEERGRFRLTECVPGWEDDLVNLLRSQELEKKNGFQSPSSVQFSPTLPITRSNSMPVEKISIDGDKVSIFFYRTFEFSFDWVVNKAHYCTQITASDERPIFSVAPHARSDDEFLCYFSLEPTTTKLCLHVLPLQVVRENKASVYQAREDFRIVYCETMPDFPPVKKLLFSCSC